MTAPLPVKESVGYRSVAKQASSYWCPCCLQPEPKAVVRRRVRRTTRQQLARETEETP